MNWGVPEWDSTYPQPRELTPREWAWEFRRRDPQYRLDWIHHAYRARFDPTKAAVEPAFMQSNARMHIGPADLSLAQSEAAVVIHLGQPPAAQFAEATRSLPKSQHRSRLRKNEYPFYLRVLDARDAGATPTEIAKFLKRRCLIYLQKPYACGSSTGFEGQVV
jgi:hypothetical protein